ncbi:glycoside hydrolase family 92 protein [Rhizoctonia solani]|uniref:Glycoside hydrolase family 92 protein n=1 Tax=Rhizoctonia solani TaxID=456999 RepID=A0A8H8NZZ6_9AGAM|nr:glycoside hydrolase family 92 protein [Rhizoctonia solani]QRW22023.1 glycoside hydrolase family 92 protein [Rhizoctonia solani]
MIKIGLDTDSPDRHVGYDHNISYNATGFSQLHQDKQVLPIFKKLSKFKLDDFLGSWGLDGIYPLVVASQSNGGVYIHGRVDDDVARVKRPQILISTPPQALSFPKPLCSGDET